MSKKMNLDLHLFGAGENVNVTEGAVNTLTGAATASAEGLSEDMRAYYADYLIDNAEPNLIHDQFAQKHPIPPQDRKSTRLNSSHTDSSRMPSSA